MMDRLPFPGTWRRHLLAQVEQQCRLAQMRSTAYRSQLFGTFLSVSLAGLGYSTADLASILDIEVELVEAIMHGLLSATEIDDDLLRQIAQVLQYDVGMLQLMLGRGSSLMPEPPAQPHAPDETAPATPYVDFDTQDYSPRSGESTPPIQRSAPSDAPSVLT